MKRKKQTREPEPTRDRFEVKANDYTPRVGKVRHLNLTLPKSHPSYYGGGRIDTTVTLSADEADTLAEQLRTAASELRQRA